MTLENDFKKAHTSLKELKEKLSSQSFSHPTATMAINKIKQTVENFIGEINAMAIIALTLEKFEK